MENKFGMFLEILGKFRDSGLLEELVLVGSWCMPFYEKLLSHVGYSPTLRTRDVDFAIPNLRPLRATLMLEQSLKPRVLYRITE